MGEKNRYDFIIIVCVMVFFITGCGKTDNHINMGQEITENNGLSWQASYSQLENQYVLALVTEHLYGCYVKDDQILIDIMNKQDTSMKETLTLSDASFIAGMASDQKGNVYLLGNKGESTGLWRIDTEGNLQDYVEMDLENTEKTCDLFMKGIYADQNWCLKQKWLRAGKAKYGIGKIASM